MISHQQALQLEFWMAGKNWRREKRDGNSESKFEGSISVSIEALLEINEVKI